MEEILQRMAENLLGRVSGPMSFRLILQPVMAAIFAVIAGLNDARAGKPPYTLTMLTDPVHRLEMMKDGWRRISAVFFVAVLLDVVYQYWVQGVIYPGEVVIVAFLLAVVPYLALRGTVNRIARRMNRSAGRKG